jgi:hypothetical protein
MPARSSSVYADEGNVAHGLAETFLRNGTPVDYRMVDEIIEYGDSEIKVTEEMLDAIQIYLDTIRNDVEELYGELSIECKFQLSVDPEAFGTADAVMFMPYNKLVVYDYKHGKGKAVAVEKNPQLLYYALGAYEALSDDDKNTIDSVEAVIVQPRCPENAPVQRTTYSVNALMAFKETLKEAIGRVRSNDPTVQSGSWCQFCSAKPICPAIRTIVNENAKVAFAEEPDLARLQKPEVLSPEELGQLLTHIPTIEAWCAAVVGYAQGKLSAGESVPGYKLVRKKSNRKWVDEEAARSVFVSYLGDEALTPQKLRSPAQIEKIKTMKDLVSEHSVKPDGGLTLAPEADKREAVTVDILALYSHI